MMRFVFWLIVLPLAVLMALFGIANSETARLDLDPFPYAIELPLFAVVLAAVFVGLVIGGVSAWIGQGQWRRQARGLNRRVRQLERELENARARTARPALPNGAREGGGRRRAAGG